MLMKLNIQNTKPSIDANNTSTCQQYLYLNFFFPPRAVKGVGAHVSLVEYTPLKTCHQYLSRLFEQYLYTLYFSNTSSQMSWCACVAVGIGVTKNVSSIFYTLSFMYDE